VALQATFLFVHLVWQGLAGRFLPGADLAGFGWQFGWLLRLQTVAWALTAVLFLAWLHSAYDVLPALGVTGVSHSATGAVGTFLVPGVNLVRPPRVLAELWHASARGGTGRGSERMPGWVTAWWTLFLASVAVDILVSEPTGRGKAPLGLGGAMPLMVAGELLRIAAAVLAVKVVLTINRYQRERAEVPPRAGQP
jgi:hypothetical protein